MKRIVLEDGSMGSMESGVITLPRNVDSAVFNNVPFQESELEGFIELHVPREENILKSLSAVLSQPMVDFDRVFLTRDGKRLLVEATSAENTYYIRSFKNPKKIDVLDKESVSTLMSAGLMSKVYFNSLCKCVFGAS